MNNYIQPGDVLTFTAPIGGVVSGTPVLIENLLVIPTGDAEAGDPFEGATRGVFLVPKVGSQAWTTGEVVYWDDDNTRFTTVANDARAGVAAADAGAGAGVTTGIVRLDGVSIVEDET